MNRKMLGTALIAASATMVVSGCGILQAVGDTVASVPVPKILRETNSYVVQPGDTVNSVASRYKIDPAILRNTNSLQTAELVPGQRIVLARNSSSSLSESNTVAQSGNGGISIGGAQANGVVTPVPAQGAIQQVTARRSATDPSVIETDLIMPMEEKEEIVAMVGAPQDDALLDDRPLFIADADIPARVSEIERPQGIETIVQTVNVGEPAALGQRVEIPAAASIDVSDADTNTPARRVTVSGNSRGWNWPVLGQITNGFDLREINRQGLDIDPGPGAAVQAAADGEVVYSGRDLASYGNLVILRHDNNFLSAYSKVSEIFVQENQRVKAGDLIASVGEANEGGTEMHFEIRQNGEPVNPVDYLPAL